VDAKKIASVVLGGAALAGAAYLIYRVLKEQYSFVEEQQVDLRLLPVPVLEEAFESETTYREKLDRARYLVHYGKEKYSTDFAAFLAFAALEEFLRNLIRRFGVNLKTKLTGIVDACRRLRSVNGAYVINREDYDRLNALTKNIRNPLVHGEIYKKEEVPGAIEFIDDFMQRYEPIVA
jgi:hypothetical protein